MSAALSTTSSAVDETAAVPGLPLYDSGRGKSLVDEVAYKANVPAEVQAAFYGE